MLLLLGIVPNIYWLRGLMPLTMLSGLIGIALLFIRIEQACEVGLSNGKVFIIKGREELATTLFRTLRQSSTQY